MRLAGGFRESKISPKLIGHLAKRPKIGQCWAGLHLKAVSESIKMESHGVLRRGPSSGVSPSSSSPLGQVGVFRTNLADFGVVCGIDPRSSMVFRLALPWFLYVFVHDLPLGTIITYSAGISACEKAQQWRPDTLGGHLEPLLDRYPTDEHLIYIYIFVTGWHPIYL